MTLEQLKMLNMVAQHGTLKGASQALFKTQPAISQGLKQLESQLGLELFSRQGYRLALTQAGWQIHLRAQRLLSEADEIQQLSAHLARGMEASVTLAFDASFDLTRILPILEMTQQAFPDTAIILKQEHMSGAFEAVLKDNADLAITPSNSYFMESEAVQGVKLYQGALISVAAPRLLKRHPQLTQVDELRNEYQIVVQDSGQASKGKEMGVQQGQRRWYVNDYSTKKILTLSGMGWGKLPDNLIADELANGSLCKLQLEGVINEVSVDYYAVKQESKILGPVASKLWESLSLLATAAL